MGLIGGLAIKQTMSFHRIGSSVRANTSRRVMVISPQGKIKQFEDGDQNRRAVVTREV